LRICATPRSHDVNTSEPLSRRRPRGRARRSPLKYDAGRRARGRLVFDRALQTSPRALGSNPRRGRARPRAPLHISPPDGSSGVARAIPRVGGSRLICARVLSIVRGPRNRAS
jgi:hypothetical protein